jgi:hypothetical protein
MADLSCRGRFIVTTAPGRCRLKRWTRTAIDGYGYAQPLLRAILGNERIITLDIKRMTPMLDKPVKTYELIDLLEAAVPFAAAVRDYQKHRMKKLKKQTGMQAPYREAI